MSLAQNIQDIQEIHQTRYIGIVSFTILLWDHIVTFALEVEYVWKQSKGPLVYLFLFNRYIMPLAFIINITAYNLQSWSIDTCADYVRYEGAMATIGLEVVALMMLLRIHALYQNKILPIIFLLFIFVGETGMNTWLLTHGIAVPHPSTVHSCTMIFDVNSAAAATWAWLPLVYDTAVLLLTLYRIVPSVRHKEAGKIMQTMLQDGLLYYGVILCAALAPTVLLVAVPPGIKGIASQLQLLITITMMSRITLHLKEQGHFYGHTSTGPLGDDAEFGITFARDSSFSDATIRTRSRSFTHSDYLTGGADVGVNFVRPSPLRRLSTICSERTSSIGKRTSDNTGGSPVSISATISGTTRDQFGD